MNKVQKKTNEDKIHELEIKEKETELRWAQEVGVDFGRNFTRGLPHNWNATHHDNSAVEEFSLSNDEETESSGATVATSSVVVITGLILGASCIMMSKKRNDEMKIEDHQTSLIGGEN